MFCKPLLKNQQQSMSVPSCWFTCSMMSLYHANSDFTVGNYQTKICTESRFDHNGGIVANQNAHAWLAFHAIIVLPFCFQLLVLEFACQVAIVVKEVFHHYHTVSSSNRPLFSVLLVSILVSLVR
jgi:hypothetical protein